MAKSPQCAKDLAAVMRSLHEAGATAIHVIAYSLGAQVPNAPNAHDPRRGRTSAGRPRDARGTAAGRPRDALR
eukprot:3195058-Prymnesium_polylepis.1